MAPFMHQVSRGSGVTLWRQIAETLSQDLAAGKLKPGDRLPTEIGLAERFAVNRHTIRRAMSALADQGYIRVEQGRGTFVAEHMLDYALGRRTRFSANLQAQGREASGRMLASGDGRADSTVARELDLAVGSPVVWMHLVGEADGIPIVFSRHWFPAPRLARVPTAYAVSHSVTAALHACGVNDYVRKSTRLAARMPDEEEARHLSQPINRPVMSAESVNIDAQGRPIQFSRACFAGDRVQVLVEPD